MDKNWNLMKISGLQLSQEEESLSNSLKPMMKRQIMRSIRVRVEMKKLRIMMIKRMLNPITVKNSLKRRNRKRLKWYPKFPKIQSRTQSST